VTTLIESEKIFSRVSLVCLN